MMAGGCFDYLDILKVLEQQQNEHKKIYSRLQENLVFLQIAKTIH